MNFSNSLLPIISILLCTLNFLSAQEIHREDYPIYSNPEILLTDPELNTVIIAKETSLDEDIGQATITYAGDLLRQADFQEYFDWYSANFHPESDIEYLKPRSTSIHESLEKLWGKYLVHTHTFQGQKYATVFVDGRREPVLITAIKTPDLSQWIQSELLKGKKTQRLTLEERRREQERPEDSYYNPLRMDRFIAVGMGQHFQVGGDPQAQAFDDFDGRNYADSAEIYRWAKIHSPMYRLNLGFVYEELLGAGLAFNYSSLYMNYNPATHPGVQVWYYDRYDIGVFGTLGQSYRFSEKLSLYPHLYIAFQYAIFDEQFEIDRSNIRSEERVKIPTLTGASGALGLKALYDNTWGIELSYGLTHVSGKSPENFQTDGNGQSSSGRPPASLLNEQYFMIQMVWNSRHEF